MVGDVADKLFCGFYNMADARAMLTTSKVKPFALLMYDAIANCHCDS